MIQVSKYSIFDFVHARRYTFYWPVSTINFSISFMKEVKCKKFSRAISFLKKPIVTVLCISAFLILIYLYLFTATTVQKYYQAGCAILDENSHIVRLFNGSLCIFLNNGDFISSNLKENIRYFDKTGHLIWESDKPALHQLKLSNAGKNFLAITSETKKINGRNIRADVFSVRDFQNKILKSWSTFDNYKKLQLLDLSYFKNCKDDCYWPTLWLSPTEASDVLELTHANSFQEISIKEEIFGSNIWKAGNYLIYLYGPLSVALVLDSDLKNILWSYDFKKIDRIHLHDLQLIAGAKLLVFFNSNIDAQTKTEYSSLEILDLAAMQTTWKYAGRPPEKFFSKLKGSVQILDNSDLLYSVDSEWGVAGYIINTSGVEIYRIGSSSKSKSREQRAAQDIKQVDLSEFLKNNLL